MITIVDYEAGNLASVQNAFRYLGQATQVTSDPDVVARGRRLVIPGVGHFNSTAFLSTKGLRDAICSAIDSGALVLGICLGMQWMFEASEEAPELAGLGAFSGECRKFPASVKSPHVGWNSVRRLFHSRLLAGLPTEFFVYYAHSYRASVADGAVGSTDYGGPFAAVIERHNLFGSQFHPEKSGAAGLRIIQNFVSLSC